MTAGGGSTDASIARALEEAKEETIGQISFGGDMKPLPAELQIFRAEIYAKKPHKEVCRRFMLLGDFVYHSVQDEKARLRILRHLAVGFRLMIEEVPTP